MITANELAKGQKDKGSQKEKTKKKEEGTSDVFVAGAALLLIQTYPHLSLIYPLHYLRLLETFLVFDRNLIIPAAAYCMHHEIQTREPIPCKS